MSIHHLNNHACKHCGSTIINGRKDKKFCDKKCSNDYHNERNSEANHAFNKVEKILRNNFRVIDTIYKSELDSDKVNQKLLLRRGFKDGFYTGYSNKIQSFIIYSYTLKLNQNGTASISPL